MRLRKYKGPDDFAVAIDFCSLWQGDRTEIEQTQFDEGLGGFNELYVHQYVRAIKLTSVPANETRRYNDSGWTLCESRLIDAKPGYHRNRLTFTDDFDLSGDLHSEFNKAFTNATPPVTPEAFEAELEALRLRNEAKGLPLFTNGKDNKRVPAIYRRCFQSVAQARYLHYAISMWGDSDVRALCEVLPLLRVEVLNLASNSISGAALLALCPVICTMGTIKVLDLARNLIAKEDAVAIVTMLKDCPSLETLTIAGMNMESYHLQPLWEGTEKVVLP